MPSWLVITILFALGACVGSFLNVVVYRLPRVVIPAGATLATEAWLTLRGLSTPPSHCPRCNTPLSWRDNIPVFGWLFLSGRCRYCREPISARYPIIEFITGLLFAGTYVLMFQYNLGPGGADEVFVNRFGVEATRLGSLALTRDGWLLALYLPLIACLLAASLIDAELYIIPLWIPWLMAAIGFVGHAAGDLDGNPGSLIPSSGPVVMMALGAGVGLILSLLALRFGLLRRSFADGEPLMKNEQDAIAAGTLRVEDISMPVRDYSAREVRREICYEMVFLLPVLLLAGLGGLLALKWDWFGSIADGLRLVPVVNGFSGALFGAMIGAGWVWVTRILGSLAFGREAMGMGDVHLMFGVGAILGAGVSSVAFFLAPLPGLLIHVYLIFVDPKRAVPFGPYLSMGSVLAMFIYRPIESWLGGGVSGLAILIVSLINRVFAIFGL